jgi:hypothetical protein
MSGVQFSVSDRIAVITLDNPSKLNALTPDMLVQLCGLCDQIEMDHNILASTPGRVIRRWSSRVIGCAPATVCLIALRG